MTGQDHGKRIGDVVKALWFPGAADGGRKPNDPFDVEAKFDKDLGLNTSIKASKHGGTVGLADARRFWTHQGPYRLLVAGWWQETPLKKSVREIHEFILTVEVLAMLKGDITFEHVADFHGGIDLTRFPLGQHLQAWAWAKERKKVLSRPTSHIVLNPKIDSKSQRRLQCSVKLRTLVAIASQCPPLAGLSANYWCHNDAIKSIALPMMLNSIPRAFKAAPNAK